MPRRVLSWQIPYEGKPRSFFDKAEQHAKDNGAFGLAWLRVEADRAEGADVDAAHFNVFDAAGLERRERGFAAARGPLRECRGRGPKGR